MIYYYTAALGATLLVKHLYKRWKDRQPPMNLEEVPFVDVPLIDVPTDVVPIDPRYAVVCSPPRNRFNRRRKRIKCKSKSH